MLQGKRILLTGLTGNMGGTIAEALAADNELWGLARYSGAGQQEFWNAKGVHTVVGDYAKKEFGNMPKDFDYVVHVAANTRPASVEEGLRDNSDGVAFLMERCQSAKAFLHVSTAGVYEPKSDAADVLFTEDDALGGGSIGYYTGSKLAGEGVARAMCQLLGLPTIIARMAVQYGAYRYGGLPGMFLDWILAGKTIPLRKGWTNRHSLISNDDVTWMVEPLLAAATVPATIVNWGGDVVVPTVEILQYLGELAGVEPKWEVVANGWPSFPLDPARRMAITGPCRVEWKDGLKALVDSLLESKRAAASAAA